MLCMYINLYKVVNEIQWNFASLKVLNATLKQNFLILDTILAMSAHDNNKR